MGLREDIERYNEVGERRRPDLSDFIQYGDLGHSRGDDIRIPIKIVDLPSFEYDKLDQGGVGQGGDADVGDPVGQPQPQPGDGDEGEPGDEAGEHDYYEMDPEEFAEEMDEELGLELEPKGKKVKEITEGDYTDTSRKGPNALLDMERLFKEATKEGLARAKDEDYLINLLQVDGIDPDSAFEIARTQHSAPVSQGWLEREYNWLDEAERAAWDSIDAMEEERGEYTPALDLIRQNPKEYLRMRQEHEQYRHAEEIEEYEKNVVMFFIRDVSGSMREEKRDLVERVASPLNWYLTGTYDEADDRYVAHDTEAWEEERHNFFGIRSGGGTTVSRGVNLAAEIAEEEYPWSEWNRYFFVFGDGENSKSDTTKRVIPTMEETDANLFAYFETQPGGSTRTTMLDHMENEFGEDGNDDVYLGEINSKDDVTDNIYGALITEENE